MENNGKKKVGLFGGTFDPVHMGHLRAGEEIREMLGLSEVYFIPSALPPHKESSEVTPSRHRLKMLELALDSNPFFEICEYEVEKSSASYTIETLKYLTGLHADHEFYFIVGNELFSDIETWKDYRELFKLSNFAVITRPGFSNGEPPKPPLALGADFSYDKNTENVIFYRNKNSKVIAFTQIRGLEVSSTEIRRLIKTEKSIRYLVPGPVEEYIMSNMLYRGEEAQ
ncbi:MAG: nicotinate-nucleotide adenylyltransferase [Deltaproteobacteria bacterium]